MLFGFFYLIIAANICLSDSMEPILVDLGSCTEAREQICGQHEAQRLQDQAEERCSIVYRAPELFNVQSYCMIDERTDIWSLGCVLYAICFFKCPYDIIYEKGDSVALAVLSGNVDFPVDSPYSEVIFFLILILFFLPFRLGSSASIIHWTEIHTLFSFIDFL